MEFRNYCALQAGNMSLRPRILLIWSDGLTSASAAPPVVSCWLLEAVFSPVLIMNLGWQEAYLIRRPLKISGKIYM